MHVSTDILMKCNRAIIINEKEIIPTRSSIQPEISFIVSKYEMKLNKYICSI